MLVKVGNWCSATLSVMVMMMISGEDSRPPGTPDTGA